MSSKEFTFKLHSLRNGEPALKGHNYINPFSASISKTEEEEDIIYTVPMQKQKGMVIEIKFGPTETTDPTGTISICFCIDLTGSMNVQGGKSFIINFINDLSNNDISLAVTSFADFPISPWGGSNDLPYILDINATTNYESVISAVESFPSMWGNDGPESQLHALKETAQDINWGGGLRNILLITDAPFHNPESGTQQYTPDYPGPSWDDTVSVLQSRNIRVFSFRLSGSLNQDMINISNQTGGEAIPAGTSNANILSLLTSP